MLYFQFVPIEHETLESETVVFVSAHRATAGWCVRQTVDAPDILKICCLLSEPRDSDGVVAFVQYVSLQFIVCLIRLFEYCAVYLEGSPRSILGWTKIVQPYEGIMC